MTRRLAAVMITDIVGFASMAQRSESTALRLLEEHRQIVRACLRDFEGREVKTMGDGFLVEFGSALAATECGVEILRRLYERNRASEQERVDLRIGIHLGEVTPEGNDILGDAVNIASRVEPLAEPGGLAISGPVYDQVRGRLEHPIHSLPTPTLKHIAVPLAVYRVELPWKAPPVPAVTNWTDREAELESLLAAHERARRAEGSVVIVLGEPGTGKSRLVEEFLRQQEGGVFQLLRGQALRSERSVPYAPWSEAIRSFARRASPAVLGRACGPQLPEVARLVPEIVERIGGSTAAPPVEPELAEDRLMDGIVRFLARLAEESTLVVVLDDLQWADPYSQRLLRRAAHAVSGRRWLLLGVARDRDPSESPGIAELWTDCRRESACSFVTLGRLAPAAFDRFLDALLPGISPTLRGELRERCDGNPWFAEELLRRQIATGGLRRTPDGWGRDPAARLRVPETVQQLVRDRLDGVDPATLQVLRSASVVGGRVPYSLLRSVCGTPDDLLLLCVERGLQARIWDERPTSSGDIELAFRDTLTRDVLYEGLSLVRARTIHRKVGEGLELLPQLERREQASRLADHFLRGGVPERALEYSIVAAQRAVELCAHPEAEYFYRTALDLMDELGTPDPRRPETVRALAKELELLGRTSEALDRYATAADLWERAGDRRRASSVHSWMAMLLNDLPGRESEVVGHSEKAVALLEAEGGSAELAQAYYSLGAETLRWRSDLAKGRELLRSSVDLASAFGDTRTEAFGTYLLALVLPLARKSEALGLATRLTSKLEANDDPTQPGILFNVGTNLFLGGKGDLEAARRYLEKARSVAQRKGIRRYDTAVALGLAEVDRLSGAWPAADAVARRVLADEPEENLLERAEASFLLARLATGRGRLEEAGRVLHDLDAPKYRALLASPEARLPLALIRAEWEYESGRGDEGWASLAPALEDGAKNEPTFGNALAWTNALYLGVALAALRRDLGSLPSWLDRLRAVASAVDEPWARAWSLAGQGIEALSREAPAEAVGFFEESVRAWERLPWKFETAKALFALGGALRAAKRPEPAEEALDRAAAIFAELGADRYANRIVVGLRAG